MVYDLLDIVLNYQRDETKWKKAKKNLKVSPKSRG